MLSHLRVLDLTDGGASITGRILADLGAEVILIEAPGGAASRRLGPYADDIEDPENSLEFWSRHRGKRSLEIDLTQAGDRERLGQLVRASDVWIEDRSVAGLADAGFSPNAVCAMNPRLIHTVVSPFGDTGPKRDWAATDLTIAASSHAMWMTGDADRAPLSCSVPQATLHAGGEAASAIMIALAERENSGFGQHIDVSAQTAMMQAGQSGVLAHGWKSQPLTRSGGGVAVGDYRLRFVYECADGYVNLTLLFGKPIGVSTGRFFDWMEEEGYSNDALRGEDWVAYGAKFLGGHTTVEAHEAMMEAIERFTRTKTKAELFAAAFLRRLLIVPLSDVRDLVDSEQLAFRDFWSPIKQAQIDREVLHPGAFARFSATPITVDTAAPTLSDYSAEIEANIEALESGTAPEASSSPKPAQTPRALPLAGLKVLDFTWVYAGPAVTRQLADYGANVIKVESSSAPDALRANGPFVDEVPGNDRSANFSNVNLGKRSIGLNLKTGEGLDIAKRLIDWADVVVENFSPKAMKNWGLDWESVRKDNPDLIMLSSSLSGGTGPQAMLAGYGTMGGALAGFGYVTGWADRRPAAPYMAYTDYVSPRFALPALLAALDHRNRTGTGQHIDLSQAECSIHFLGAAPLDYTVNQRVASAHGNSCPHYAPSGVYATQGDDRWIAIAAPTDETWSALARYAGQGWAEDTRFVLGADRITHNAELDAEINAWTQTQDRAELEARLQTLNIPSHRVVDTHDAFEDAQLLARDHFIPIEYGDLGSLPYEASRVRLSATPAITKPCPYLGQHNQEILTEVLGLDDEAITELVIAGAIE